MPLENLNKLYGHNIRAWHNSTHKNRTNAFQLKLVKKKVKGEIMKDTKTGPQHALKSNESAV